MTRHMSRGHDDPSCERATARWRNLAACVRAEFNPTIMHRKRIANEVKSPEYSKAASASPLWPHRSNYSNLIR